MGLFDYFSQRRAVRLADRGFEHIRDAEYDKALAVADEIRPTGYTAAFEIAALAHHGKGEPERAIRELEAAVQVTSEVWSIWQLLGNYRSERGLHEEAEAAYRAALKCPGADRSSVSFNQAIVASKKGDHQDALDLLDDVVGRKFASSVASARVIALRGLGRLEDAEDVLMSALAEADDLDPDLRGGLEADLCRVRLQRGKPKDEVRALALAAWERARTSPALLELFREIDARSSPTARGYRLQVNARMLAGLPVSPNSYGVSRFSGFVAEYSVVADNPEEGLTFIRTIEMPATELALSITESRVLQDPTDAAKGVYAATARVFYVTETP